MSKKLESSFPFPFVSSIIKNGLNIIHRCHFYSFIYFSHLFSCCLLQQEDQNTSLIEVRAEVWKKLLHYLNFISVHIDHGINRSSVSQRMGNRKETDRKRREDTREWLSVNECAPKRRTKKDNLRILAFNCWIHASPVLGTTWRRVVKSGRHPYSLAFSLTHMDAHQRTVTSQCR